MENKTYNEKWQDALVHIKNLVTPISFDTWFKPLTLKSVDEPNNLIYFDVYNALLVKVINDRYLPMLEEKIYESFGTHLKAVFMLPEADKSPGRLRDNPNDNPFPDEFIFNPKFTFDNFVVGEHNKFAHAAAYAVAESPSTAYNPLFIYGDSGLGKTHLMHAIGIHIMNNHPELSILYVSSEMFTNELIDALRDTKNNKQKMKDFKNKYRNQDVLLIDDVQFIEGKDSTEEELFHTFNALYDNNKQIVLSADRPPSKLTRIDERLRSRFEWNIVADIQAPDFETRVAILQTKAELEGIPLTPEINEVIDFIAERVKFNVREMEGDLSRVIGFSNLLHEDVNLRFAKNVLKELAAASDVTITPEKIKKKVCNKFGLKMTDMESSKRTRSIAYPRQIAMYLCRELTDLSFPKIGESFGGRDHTTVIHACDKIAYEVDNNTETKQIVNELMNILNE